MTDRAPKSIENVSVFYRNRDTHASVSRKTWNKAVELIDSYDRKSKRDSSNLQSTCLRHGAHSRTSGKQCRNVNFVLLFLREIRQAMLRHDWKTVHKLHLRLLDAYAKYRVVCNKVMLVSLFSSSMSDQGSYMDFCRMAGGMDDAEMTVFTRTIKRLPAEIPRGFICGVGGKLFVKESGKFNADIKGVADAYVKASLPVRRDSQTDYAD